MEEIMVGEPKKKNKKLKYILSICFLLLLIVVTICVIFTKYNMHELFNVMKKVDKKYVLIGVSLIFVYIFFEGAAMKVILNVLGLKVSMTDNFVYSATDYYFCAVTPSASGGQPMVAYYMTKDNIPIPSTSLTLLINTALFKIVLLVLSLVSLIFCHEYIFSRPLLIVLFVIGFLINIFLISICFLAAFKRNWIEAIGKRLILWLANLHLIKKPCQMIRSFNKKMEEYEAGAKLIKSHPGKFTVALVFNFIQRIALFSMAFFVYYSFLKAYPLKKFGFIDLFAIQVIIALCVDSLPLPGGVGISEYLYVFLFGIIYGTEDIVASAMLVTRAVSFYIPLIVTAIIVIIKHIRVLTKAKIKES